jgi:hypothetical protein
MHKQNHIARRNDTGLKIKKHPENQDAFSIIVYGLYLDVIPSFNGYKRLNPKIQSKKIPFWDYASMVTGFSKYALSVCKNWAPVAPSTVL